MADKPQVPEVHEFLRKYNALVVHFSGTPKGAGSNFEHRFPNDLLHVVGGNAQSGFNGVFRGAP
jgi:hypothetical protein